MTPPTPPEEIYGFEGTRGEIRGMFRTEAEAFAESKRRGCYNGALLIGVHPRHRDAIERIALLIAGRAHEPYDGTLALSLLGKITTIVAEVAAGGNPCGKSDVERSIE